MKKILIFHWPHNRKLRRDGDEFRNRAEDALDYYTAKNAMVIKSSIPKVDKPHRRQWFRRELSNYENTSIDRILFFCHGQPRAMDAGFSLINVQRMADLIGRVATDDCRIGLYCCWTGRDVDGFAAQLSDRSGLPVLAHTTRGHVTRNPKKITYHNGETYPHYDKWAKEAYKKYYYLAELKNNRFYPFKLLEWTP